MHPSLKKILRALSLEIRHTLEGSYDAAGVFHPGDLETRLNELGVWRERTARTLPELPHLSAEDRAARQVIDAYIAYRAEAGVERAEAVAEFVREAAYNWANRLLALRCMEARGIIDEVVLQKAVYGGRSMVHNRLARKDPQACAGPDEGLFAMLSMEFQARAEELPELFAPHSPAIALRPSLPALKRVIGLLSGTLRANGQEPTTDEVFSAPDALGWAYQYWNSEEKDRVFEKVRTQKGAKIEGADIIPATQLYTEPYMVKFLVQNSLGALWKGMHPGSNLVEGWEYYVKGADRAPVERKHVQDVTLLDPACGSGHFLLEAFDLLYSMYQEEDASMTEAEIAASILNHNLYGIDIDERAVQIAAAALWMKAQEAAPDLDSSSLTDFHHHLVATNIRLPKGKDHLKAFLAKHPESAPLQPALEAIFEGLENVHELGSLVQIEEPVDKELHYLRGKYESIKKKGVQPSFFEPVIVQGELPLGMESYDHWKKKILNQLETFFAIESKSTNVFQSFFGFFAKKSLVLFEILSNRYSIVTTNPPYMGSRGYSAITKNYTEKYYKDAKTDLCTCFMIRAHNFLEEYGRVAMVTQHSWMFLRSYWKFRSGNNGDHPNSKVFNGILKEGALELLAHLGSNAFNEIGGEVVSVVLFVLSKTKFIADNYISAFRVVGINSPQGKSEYLLKNRGTIPYKIKQDQILKLEASPIIYWLTNNLMQLLTSDEKISKCVHAGGGVGTRNESRFLRKFWEVPFQNDGWVPYAKGGNYQKWVGLLENSVDWKLEGVKVKNSILSKYPYLNGNYGFLIRDEEFHFEEGLTYTDFAQGSFSCRELTCSGPIKLDSFLAILRGRSQRPPL